MTAKKPKKSLIERAKGEFNRLLIVFTYLAFFFCTLTTHGMVLQKSYSDVWLNLGEALVKAFIIAKFIAIGEALHFGKKYEGWPLLRLATLKAFLYTLIVFAVQICEVLVVRIIDREALIGTFQDGRLDLFVRGVVIFCTFIPFFAFTELRRRIGEAKFRTLVSSHWAAPGE